MSTIDVYLFAWNFVENNIPLHFSPPGSQLATWLGVRDPRVVKTVFDKGNMPRVESRNSKRGTGIFKS